MSCPWRLASSCCTRWSRRTGLGGAGRANPGWLNTETQLSEGTPGPRAQRPWRHSGRCRGKLPASRGRARGRLARERQEQLTECCPSRPAQGRRRGMLGELLLDTDPSRLWRSRRSALPSLRQMAGAVQVRAPCDDDSDFRKRLALQSPGGQPADYLALADSFCRAVSYCSAPLRIG